ncbi:alcohol dehydrogenase [Egibacter rhizosphaerae]|uniref:Alcohol dehydrogenase n=1 Tax=Egibacter rhizosphaerae TaxID=1670831 RepID=A0A411YBL6_9ACTN|nr:zinc-binding dehydrogenase [Egibacter rhizosphaerae]QBI18568.1 alcohol dehydrogenase [Egibacter rhizosphaerae]
MTEGSRAAVLESFGAPVQLREYPVPSPEPGGAIGRVAYAGICGTDVHLQEGRLPIPLPVVLGHEAFGRIEGLEAPFTDLLGREVNDGDQVIWASNIPCGRCAACLRDQERTLCQRRRIYGINQSAEEWPHLSGGWADAIVLRPGSSVLRLPAGVSALAAISLGCAGPTVAHALGRVPAAIPHATVVVQGAGPVGLAASMMAIQLGAARVVVVGGPPRRLEIAEELGIGDVRIPLGEPNDVDDRLERVRDGMGATGADLVIECTGVPSAVVETLALARPGGTCLVVGQYTDQGATSLNPNEITRKQLSVEGSWAFSERDYATYVESLPRLTEAFELERLVTEFPLERAQEALDAVRSGTVAKAVLSPEAEP